jgi:hypothetical protein
MSKIAQYSANLQQITPLVSRNKANIITINAPSFWINDVEQADGAHQIKVESHSQKNWLKFNQEQGETCTLFPVDGAEGVFIYPPPVAQPDDFILNGKRVGGCDLLLLNDKWLFAELKTEAISPNPEQIQENRNKAALQLGRTFTYFQEQNMLLDKSNCSCMIVAPTFFPKIAKISIPQTVKFLKRFGVALIEKTTDEVVRF